MPNNQPFNAEASYYFLDESRTFTGADIKALLILPDDEKQLELVRAYLQAIENEEIKGTDDLTEAEEKVFREFDPYGGGASPDVGKEQFLPLLNLQSITISTFRNKQQVRALGHVNPRGFARGSRTSAGTMILTEFWRDSFWDLLTRNAPLFDSNFGDSGNAVLVDQLAPFDCLLLFTNEFGNVSYRYINGIEIATNGIVYSIQDMYNENTLSFVCQDVTPLTPALEDIRQAVRTGNILGTPLLYGTPVPEKIRVAPEVRNAKELVRQYRQRKNARNPFK